MGRQEEQGRERDRQDMAAAQGKMRRPYHPPRFEILGDLRDLTLGVSPGTGDSNNPFVFQA